MDVAKKGSTGVPGNLFELLVKDAQEKHEVKIHVVSRPYTSSGEHCPTCPLADGVARDHRRVL